MVQCGDLLAVSEVIASCTVRHGLYYVVFFAGVHQSQLL